MNFAMMIFLFFGGLVCQLVAFLNDIFFGNVHDGEFSLDTLKKITVKNDSIFRKILPFKELKGSVRPKYLYIRIIPFVIHIILLVLLLILFL